MRGGLTWICVRARAVLCVQLLSRCRHRHAHGEARQRPNSFCNLSPGKYDLTVWRWMFCLDTSLGWMNKFVKGLVQVAVGAERCHMGLVLLWPGSSGLIIKTIGSLPCSMCCHSGSHTLGEALGEQHRLLPSMAFISREKHRNHFSKAAAQDWGEPEWVLHCDLPKVDLASALTWLWEKPGMSCSAGKLNINTLTHVKTRPRSHCQDQYILRKCAVWQSQELKLPLGSLNSCI